MNMGAYFHVAPRLKTCFNENSRSSPHQVRPASASAAPRIWHWPGSSAPGLLLGGSLWTWKLMGSRQSD